MSTTAQKIADYLITKGWAHRFQCPRMVEDIDQVLAGKIIKKSEVDHLRLDGKFYVTEIIKNSNLEKELGALRREASDYFHKMIESRLDAKEREEVLKATVRSNLNNWLKAEARESELKTKLAVAEQELNTYKQAEEVENRLDEAERREASLNNFDPTTPIGSWMTLNGTTYYPNPAPVTWSWRGEPHTSPYPFNSTSYCEKLKQSETESQPLTWWQQIKNTWREFTN